jgi:hypothetical protein
MVAAPIADKRVKNCCSAWFHLQRRPGQGIALGNQGRVANLNALLCNISDISNFTCTMAYALVATSAQLSDGGCTGVCEVRTCAFIVTAAQRITSSPDISIDAPNPHLRGVAMPHTRLNYSRAASDAGASRSAARNSPVQGDGTEVSTPLSARDAVVEALNR